MCFVLRVDVDNFRLGVTETTKLAGDSGKAGSGQNSGAGGVLSNISGSMSLSGRDRGLLPDRHPTADFFICDVLDAIPKDDMASMEHPLFSLATRPDRRILRYSHGASSIEITPSVKGLATIHDKDILIYCISQLMAAVNAGEPVAQTLHLKAHDLLVATNRETSGNGYKRLREAFERLVGTRITTTIPTGTVEVTSGFGLIESWEIVRHSRAGRMISVSVKLSDWLYRAVMAKSVLTLSRDYFRLRKPLERRVYEIARKHCGRQGEWRIGLETLLKKSGSASPRRVFRKMVRDMIAADHLPDYYMHEETGDIIRFTLRDRLFDEAELPALRAETIERARALAPEWDIYALEAEWRDVWARTGRTRLRSPDGAFLGWLKARG